MFVRFDGKQVGWVLLHISQIGCFTCTTHANAHSCPVVV